MSVLSEVPINANFEGLFHTAPPVDPEYTADPLDPVYFQGFPSELVFNYYYQSDGRRWSAEIESDVALWAAMFLMMRSLGQIEPLRWPNR